MKTYINFCSSLEGDSLNIYWRKECFQQLWKKINMYFISNTFSIIVVKIIKQKKLCYGYAS